MGADQSGTDAGKNIPELRKALGDESKDPRYIETAHRLGYRFIVPVSIEPVQSLESGGRIQDAAPAHSVGSPNPHFVGRHAEFVQLHLSWERAQSGERQIVFVTGEPGIGKTTLVEEFLRQQQLAVGQSLWIGRGQCIERYGAREAYLPLLDALERLGRQPGGGWLLKLLDKHAPTWLLQLPAQVGAGEHKELQGRAAGAYAGANAARAGRRYRSNQP